MAGDWIQKDTNLRDKPEFIRLVDLACDLKEFQELPGWAVESTIEGLLMQLWSWVDTSTDDGHFPKLTARSIARKLGGTEGFWCCVADPTVNWVNIDETGVSIPGYEKRFSQSAKRRITDARRKASARVPQPVRKASTSCPQNVRTDADKNRTQCGAKEEKRREEHACTETGPKETTDAPPKEQVAFAKQIFKDLDKMIQSGANSYVWEICQKAASDPLELQATEEAMDEIEKMGGKARNKIGIFISEYEKRSKVLRELQGQQND